MAEGFSRNKANEFAIKSRKSGLSYQKYYEYEYSWLRISIVMQKVGDSLENVAKAMNLASSTMISFNETMCAVAQSN